MTVLRKLGLVDLEIGDFELGAILNFFSTISQKPPKEGQFLSDVGEFLLVFS